MDSQKISLHMRHCNQGEYVGVCKYGGTNDYCPALDLERLRAEADARAKLPTIDDLYRLAQKQPVVYQALMMVQRGDISMTHALYGMVLTLAAQLEETQARLTDCVRKQPPAPMDFLHK